MGMMLPSGQAGARHSLSPINAELRAVIGNRKSKLPWESVLFCSGENGFVSRFDGAWLDALKLASLCDAQGEASSI
jgi:hypothetical protein